MVKCRAFVLYSIKISKTAAKCNLCNASFFHFLQVHTGLLLPFDLDVAVAAEVNRASGLFTVKISVTIPKIRMICDPRQLEGIVALCSFNVI